MNTKLLYIWLTKLKINNKVKLKILEKVGGVENLYNCSLDDLVYFDVKDNHISEILNKSLRNNLEKEYEFIVKNNIDVIGINDDFYPMKFKNIDDKPIAFYIRGNKNILDMDSVGIVGSRMPYKDTAIITKNISSEVSKRGINIISGLARGVDKFAHLGCLETNLSKTVAVLGTGIDDESIYPYENKRVFERILENDGAIISEYPLRTKPYSYNFPYRNRLISALSDAIILMQSSLKSGGLITVDYALEQGKDVYVYSGKYINTKEFEGNKMLIEQGAWEFS